MIIENGKKQLFKLTSSQLTALFLLCGDERKILMGVLDVVLARVEKCFTQSENKYYKKDDETYFNPFHSGQYCIYLYFLSNTLSKQNHKLLADKVYYLNKTLNACDIYHEVNLPDVFFLDHPVGTVLGRGIYGNRFSFGQNSTVGNNKGIYPVIGENVRLCANSLVLGNSNIGNNVILGAGTCVKDQDVPSNSLVFGSSPNLIIKRRKDV